ncbi:MAG: COG1361 S-layer family protein [Nanoarchaeota archaeon]
MKKQINLILILVLAVYLISLSSALNIESVTSNPEQVAPGEKLDVFLRIANDFDYDAENIKVSVDLMNSPISPKISSEFFLDKIKKNNDEEVEFGFIADAEAEPGIYKIPIKIEYVLDGTQKIEVSMISIIINSKPNLMINSESVLLKNQKNDLDIEIINKGLGKTKFLEIELSQSGDYNILSSNKVYIGDLDSDDFDSAKFEIYSKDKSYIIIPVTLKYKDALNKVYVENQEITVRSYSTDEATKLGLIKDSNFTKYLVAILLIVVLFLIYRKLKKRK